MNPPLIEPARRRPFAGTLLFLWMALVLLLYLKTILPLVNEVTPIRWSLPVIGWGTSYLWTCGKGLLVALWTGYLCLHIGKILLNRLAASDQLLLEERVVFSAALGIGVLSLGVLALGTLHLWKSTVFWVLGIGLTSLFLWKDVPSRRFTLLISWHPRNRVEKVGGIALFVLFLMIFFFCLTPEIFYDALHYHLAVPNLYRIAQRVYPMPNLMHSNFVQMPQLAYGWAITLGNALSAKLLHSAMGLLLALAYVSFGRRFLSAGSGVLSGLIFFSAPFVVMSTTSASVDVAASFYVFASAYALLLAFDVLPRPGMYFCAGILSGLAASCKPTLLPIPIVAALLIVWKERRHPQDTVKGVPLCAVFVAGALLAVFPWLLRQWVWYRNPVYPFGAVQGWGSPALDPVLWKTFIVEAGSRDWAKTFQSLGTTLRFLFHPWLLTMEGISNTNFIGPLYLMLLPVLFRHPWNARAGSCYKFLFFGLWVVWLTTGSVLRFFLPGLALLSPLLAEGFVHQDKSKGMLLTRLLVATCIAVNIGLGFQRLMAKEGWKVVLGLVSESTYLSSNHLSYGYPPYAGILWMNAHLPKGSKILFLDEARTYPTEHLVMANSYLDPRPIEQWTREALDAQDLTNRLREQGLTHIFVNLNELVRLGGSSRFSPSSKHWKVLNTFWKKHLRCIAANSLFSRDLDVLIFEILPVPCAPGQENPAPNPYHPKLL